MAFSLKHNRLEDITQLPRADVAFPELINQVYSGEFKLNTHENWALLASVSLNEFQRTPDKVEEWISQLNS